VIGRLVKLWPDDGVAIVAATVGGGEVISPLTPNEPLLVRVWALVLLENPKTYTLKDSAISSRTINLGFLSINLSIYISILT
jgi:hypothetical protein